MRTILDDITGRSHAVPILGDSYRTGMNMKRERSRCTRNQQRIVRDAVRAKILEGKFSHVLILKELLDEGVIADTHDHPTAPRLCRTSIHRYIKTEREALRIDLPVKVKDIMRSYKTHAYTYRRNIKALCNLIAKECDVTVSYVRQILTRNGKIQRRSYIRRYHAS